MKTSLVTSAVLHALVLIWALVSLGSPPDFQVADVEAMPVDMVPIEELTKLQQGDKEAPKAEIPSVMPTKRPDTVENAENVGENKIDLKTPPKPDAKPNNVEAAAAPEKAEKTPPTPDPVKEDSKEVTEEKPASEPATEVAALPEPKEEVKPDAKPEEQPAEEKPAENPDAEALPDKVPTPMAKPKVEKPAQTAKTPDRKKEENQKEKKKASSANDSDFNADEVAALLNKTDPANGGAKSGKTQKAFGASKTTGNTLSQNEMDALRGQIQKNWSAFAGIEGLDGMILTVKFELDPQGNIIGDPEVETNGGSATAQRTMAGSVRRAILKSLPFEGLPADKYDSWREMVVNFDPSSMSIQ
ncbi:TolA protein [Pararhizobium capsulatum DSM 1112]|uniref:TolA protein n=1 Tax=Pararhizobium capsulatum DSM 1112 TaxID=1121113 RepID=A0ABU0BU31_9HYPH|nr:cell envelope integrity protein TolA [Pararhizobium capsulatum]MDQ0321765.1 TolA protein [Pararhizobium capsulatum DSM 1112]